MYALYYATGSCSLGPHIILAELGVEYELRRVDFASGEQRAPAFRAINPKGRVPALVLPSGPVLTETGAIMLYLARLHPHARLLPDNLLDEARACEWLSWLASGVHATSVAAIWRPERFSDDELARDSIRARGRRSVREDFSLIEKQLNGRDFAAGPRYSVADAYLAVIYRWGSRLGFDMRAEYPAWSRLMEVVNARPGVQQALSEQGITLYDLPS